MRLSAVNQVSIPIALSLGSSLLLGYYFGGEHPLQAAVVFIIIFGIPLLLIHFGLKKIVTLILANVAISIAMCISCYSFGYRPGICSQTGGVLGCIYLFLMLVVSFVAIFRYWEKYSVWSVIPFIILLLCFWAGAASLKMGHNKRLAVFNERLPQYREAVGEMKSRLGAEPVFLKGMEVPEKYRHLAYWIHAEENNRGALVVTFFWGSGFPVKHSAFVYRSDGWLPPKGSDFRREWPFIERINEHWFRVGD